MAKKTTTTRTKRRFSSGISVKSDPPTGRFVLGRAAFACISEVEGIKLSKGMEAALSRTAGLPADKRRNTLAAKYGKK
jgi:hypothetical protein